MTTRRSFLTGLLSTPAVITTPGLLMPVRAWGESVWCVGMEFELARGLTSRVRFVNCDFGGHEAGFIVRNGQVRNVTLPEWRVHD